MYVKSLLSEYFCNMNKIDFEKEYTIEKVNAKSLMVSNRIDLIAKLKYIEFSEKGYDMTFVKQLYQKHMEAFSYGTYKEPGNVSKNSIEDYFKVFDALIGNIKNSGIDETVSVIPVGMNNTILDGAHRTAIAAYFNLEVPIVRFDHLTVDYGTEFFRERVLDEVYLDYLVTQYCKLKSNMYFACIWPKAKGKAKLQQAKQVISNTCNVVYHKNIQLNYVALYHLIIQIYSSQEWIGNSKNHFLGAQNKVADCYDKNERLTCYILECDSLDEILRLKTKIRDIFNIGNESIHITDSSLETSQMVNLLLNQKSVECLNNAKSKHKAFLLKLENIFKRKRRNFKYHSKINLIKLLKKMRVYESIRSFYYLLRDEK